MRCWHKDLIKYLPELQLKSQWRELVLMAKDLHEKGFTNHLLINRLMSYNVHNFNSYCQIVMSAMIDRGIAVTYNSWKKLAEYTGFEPNGMLTVDREHLFEGWHNKEYLRICMSNLFEKHKYGLGKSRISDEEWETLLRGYKEITGEDYKI